MSSIKGSALEARLEDNVTALKLMFELGIKPPPNWLMHLAAQLTELAAVTLAERGQQRLALILVRATVQLDRFALTAELSRSR